ncbi:hypothetical protein B0J14DRAFT_435287, partial [Halenospora varia]
RPHRLTYDRLCEYDDILTDVLVDHALYWTTIRKARKSYRPLNVTNDDIIFTLRKSVILQKNSPEAISQILKLPSLKQYSESFQSPGEAKDFYHHMKKYLDIYLPDCPFEISSTSRYSAFEQHASVVARKRIVCGEEIRYLCGTTVPLHEEEVALLARDGRDFSIVESSRQNTTSGLLGPIRFANHKCVANARIDLQGSSAKATAIKNIEVGQEITFFYADDYF